MSNESSLDETLRNKEKNVSVARAFFIIWPTATIFLGFVTMEFAKARGAEFYLLSLLFVPFISSIPLAMTVGVCCLGVAKINEGSIKQGKLYKLLGLILSISVYIFLFVCVN